MEVASMQQAGFPIELVFPTEGTSYEVAFMSIIRGARNPPQARRFYDWLQNSVQNFPDSGVRPLR